MGSPTLTAGARRPCNHRRAETFAAVAMRRCRGVEGAQMQKPAGSMRFDVEGSAA